MYDGKKIKELILVSLVADSYSLGAHWIYDDKQLASLDINWDELNDAKAVWHKDKKAGEFTHYGDQTLWLYEFLQNKNKFDVEEYLSFWENKMQSYNGYIDGATRESLENIKDDKRPSGSESTDLSIVGRIAPLLLVSSTKQEFLENVETFVKVTHNSNDSLKAASFFAKVLLEVLEGSSIEASLEKVKESFDSQVQGFVSSGISSKTSDTFDTIRNFGPACDVNEGFAGVIHLLSKYDNLKDMLICNAKAGGDTSARAMIASIIFLAQENKNATQIPANWLNIKATVV